MKPLFIITFFLFTSSILISQKINQEIKLENEQSYLVGPITKDGLSSSSYQTWFENNYNGYEVTTETLITQKESLAQHKIILFMGTWCGDSKREVPRFLKILETADFPMENLKMVAVDRRKNHYKKSPSGEEWGLSIKRVPTFIFLKDGKETNRIIESPIESLESDIAKIVSQKDYTPNYPKSLHFD